MLSTSQGCPQLLSPPPRLPRPPALGYRAAFTALPPIPIFSLTAYRLQTGHTDPPSLAFTFCKSSAPQCGPGYPRPLRPASPCSTTHGFCDYFGRYRVVSLMTAGVIALVLIARSVPLGTCFVYDLMETADEHKHRLTSVVNHRRRLFQGTVLPNTATTLCHRPLCLLRMPLTGCKIQLLTGDAERWLTVIHESAHGCDGSVTCTASIHVGSE